MDQWDRVRELWIRQQRNEPPGDDIPRKEQYYYKLIEQLETPESNLNSDSDSEPSGRYHIRPESM